MMLAIMLRVRDLLNQNWGKFDEDEKRRINELLQSSLSELETLVRETDKFDELQTIVDDDKFDRVTPTPTMFNIYRRLVEISPDKPTSLLDLASYLSLFGPDWEEEEQQIINFVNANHIQQALQVAAKVDYDKWETLN